LNYKQDAMPAKSTANRKRVVESATVGDSALGNGIAALLKELWEAAVTLRGSIEPADYKRYVLPIIFLRFLSMRYEKRREELERLLADPESDYYTQDTKVVRSTLEDPDEYRSANVFIVPENARWDYLRSNAQADNIKIIIEDALQLLEDTYPEKLKGLLPRIYAGSNMSRDGVAGLINLFSKDIFKQDHGGEDVIGRVYEYFIGEFASSEGKRGGEYFTPASIVRVLVAMLEPKEGVVYDPCCGSGGMFVQSDIFTHHNGLLSFYGQESKDFTYRLCRMNLFIHGIDGNIQLGNSYIDDKHAGVHADFILANPPFNDGSKSQTGWGANLVPDKDPRTSIDRKPMPLSLRNANSMWIMHFLHHLKQGGTAGFVMATGELSSGETARLEVRRTLVEQDYVDCVVQLSGQLFANTQIPCGLWFLSKNRDGHGGFRRRKGEILFIDARRLGTFIPGSRKQKQLTDEEIERIAAIYRTFRREGVPDEIAGFCKVMTLAKVRGHNYALMPGRYVGSQDIDDDAEPFDEKMERLVSRLRVQFRESREIEGEIAKQLKGVGYGL
jgi:type I restriction enzyme M protein